MIFADFKLFELCETFADFALKIDAQIKKSLNLR